jgi:DNA-binding SARP family transcriptional activator
MSGFELVSGGRSASPPLSAQRLVALLALQERPVQRVYVAGKLWPDSREDRAMASLRSAIWRANRPGLVVARTHDSRVALAPGVRVDLRAALAQAHALIDGTAPHDVSCADFLLTGELLPDWYDDWLVIERERVRQLRLHALEALTARLVEHARYGEATETALSAIAGEPLRESAHRALIRVHLAESNPSEALRHYEMFRDLLGSALGLRPSRQLTALVEPLFPVTVR